MTDKEWAKVRKRFSKETKKAVKELWAEQAWWDREEEEFDKESLKTVKGVAYWLECFFDIYEGSCDDPEQRAKYSKAIRLLIRELECVDEEVRL